MVDAIKFITFKGLEQKVEALFRSFIELAEDELAEPMVVVDGSHTKIDIVIAAEEYTFTEAEQLLIELPTIKVGADDRPDQPNYLTLPLQWSAFKAALEALSGNFPISSSSSNETSILILETDARDLWLEDDVRVEGNVDVAPKLERGIRPAKVKDDSTSSSISAPIENGDRYWLQDIELKVNKQPLLYIRSKQKKVYSRLSPAAWIGLLQAGELSQIPLAADWQCSADIQAYPLARLLWINALLNNTEELADDLDQAGEYQLDHWPHLELLERDNILLRLCVLLFIQAESVNSLIAKSGIGRSSIIGLLNACHQHGLLKRL